MKKLSTLTKFAIAIIVMLLCSNIYSQEIGVLGNGNYISDNDVTPSTTDFTDFGTTTTRTFYVDNSQNAGNTTLNVLSISISNTTDFSINLTGFDYSIAKNQDEPFSVSYIGTGCGTFTSTVTIVSLDAGNDGADNSWVYTISKTTGPEINIRDSGANNILTASANSPAVANNTEFGNILVGSSSATRTFTIQNTNPNCPLNLTGSPIVALSNTTDFTVNYSATTTPVAGSSSTTFTITFNPITSGVKTSLVTIANNDSDENPYTFTVQGTGITPLPEISITGNGANIADGTTSTSLLNHTAFGNTGISTPVIRTYTINNTGTGTLNITTPVTLGSTGTATGTYYSVTTQPATTVAPGGSTTFQVTFNPTIRGEFIDLISIINDDSDEALFEYAISGTSYIAASGDTWYYLDSGIDLDASLPTWKTDTGLYGTWSAGPSQLGFGDGDESTVITNNNQVTTYFRKQVTASATEAGHTTLVIRTLRDDGVIVYINGTKVWQNNMGASSLNYLTPASSDVTGNPENAWLQYKLINVLNTGINEVAVEIHQSTSAKTDLSFDFALYTEDGNIPPDVDGDYVVDYLDSDVDNDGVPDIAEGCYTANLEELHTNAGTGEQSINSTLNGSSITMDDGNTITFAKTGSFVDVTSYLAGEHGWSIRVRGGPSNGTITFNYGTPVNDLFFKLSDFDENERWTVNAYDDSNNLIDLATSGNVYQLGSYINQTGNNFAEKFLGNGINNNGDAVEADPFGAIYFYFPNTLISRIEFVIDQPQGSTIRIAAMHFCGLDTDGDGIDDYHDSDSDNDGIPDTVEAGGYDTNGDGLADDFTDTDGDGLPDIYDSTPALYFAYEVTKLPDYDFDGDGIPSRIDLDSDNDGIADIVEAGDIDSDGDGQIDGFLDTDNDGYHDAYDGAGSIFITGGDANSDGRADSYPNHNQDGTGLPNFMDIDSDDDGITDNTEAQATGSYISFVATDTDGDGIVDVFENNDASWGGGGFTPVDTDGDGTPDYLDLDSDNSEEPDNIEGHDTNGDNVVNGSDAPNSNTGLFTGVDADGDGLDDGYDNNVSTYDATNSSLQPTSHPIFDGGADRDWRSTIGVSLDFDGLDDHVDCGDQSAYEFASSFSLEAWVLQETSVATGTIVSKSNAKASNGKGYQLVLNSSVPNLKFYDNSGTLLVNITSPYAITNDRWYHIAATFDGTTAKLYIDGIEVVSATSASAPAYSTELFIIGATYDSDTPTAPKNHFNGYIDEVRVWNTALNVQQMREMMNQEIEISPFDPGDGYNVRGKVIPIDISGNLKWANLEGYYDMNDDDGDDKSSNSRNGTPKNITTLQEQTAPLPYTTKANGDWDDCTATTPWTLGDSVWEHPNAVGIDGVTKIDWNIVQISHNIDSNNEDITLLGLISDTPGTTLTIANDTETLDETNSGQGLTITHYLRLEGKIDLIGESQLVQKRFYADYDNNAGTPDTTLQTSESIYDQASTGVIERDQQGTRDLFTYNYWSSPIGENVTSGNNNNITLDMAGVFRDGTTSATPANITFITNSYNGTSGAGIGIADYWIWKYANKIGDTYSQWQHVRSTGSILAGEGFTMKGVANTGGAITQTQNYVFNGKPNNGDISLTLAPGNEYLVGNPYPSALDADEFIKDNLSHLESDGRNTNGNIINGVLYFWDHFASSTHVLGEYQGGYATYTLMGGVAAISNDARINATGASGTKIPKRYIPVGQGFFVSSLTDALVTLSQPIVGGDIVFQNSQRAFSRETSGNSTFLRTSGKNAKSSIAKTSTDTRQKLRLMFDSPSGYHRQLLAGLDTNASNTFDAGYDAPLIEDNNEDMFWVIDNSNFVIQAVDNFDFSQKLPLGVKIFQEGLAKIKIEDLENITSSVNVYLHDKNLNVYHDLRQTAYEVYLTPDTYLERFEITFSSAQSLGVDDLEANNLHTYFSNEKQSLVLHNPLLKAVKSVEIINILAQSLVKFNTIEKENYHEFRTPKLSTGAYIVKINTMDGALSKKVLIK